MESCFTEKSNDICSISVGSEYFCKYFIEYVISD